MCNTLKQCHTVCRSTLNMVLSKRVHCCLLPASLRAVDLFLQADALTEEAVNVFKIHAAVRHALHSAAQTHKH